MSRPIISTWLARFSATSSAILAGSFRLPRGLTAGSHASAPSSGVVAISSINLELMTASERDRVFVRRLNVFRLRLHHRHRLGLLALHARRCFHPDGRHALALKF